jgi:hypothetical protein
VAAVGLDGNATDDVGPPEPDAGHHPARGWLDKPEWSSASIR